MTLNREDIWTERGVLRFIHDGQTAYGLWEKGVIRLYHGSPFSGGQVSGQIVEPEQIKLLPPCNPSKIIGIGLNYKRHAQEVGLALPAEPMMFLKPPSALLGQGDYIVKPPESKRVDFEAELAIVVGKTCRRVSESQALGYVLGYTCLNDVTARDLQSKDGQFVRSKGFDTFSPVGPVIALDVAPGNLGIRTVISGKALQNSNTSDLIFSVPYLVSYVSCMMTLEPGDVIATGTPEGIAPIPDGATVNIEIDGIGRLTNPVKNLE